MPEVNSIGILDNPNRLVGKPVLKPGDNITLEYDFSNNAIVISSAGGPEYPILHYNEIGTVGSAPDSEWIMLPYRTFPMPPGANFSVWWMNIQPNLPCSLYVTFSPYVSCLLWQHVSLIMYLGPSFTYEIPLTQPNYKVYSLWGKINVPASQTTHINFSIKNNSPIDTVNPHWANIVKNLTLYTNAVVGGP